MIHDKEAFKAAALDKLTEYAKSNSEFLMEDVGNHSYATGLEEPYEKRWWGAVVVLAKSEGIIEPTGRFEIQRGNRAMVIWRSLVRD